MAANVVGEASSLGPHVTVNTLVRTRARKVETEAYTFDDCCNMGGTEARTDKIGLCQFETGSAEATCPRGTKVRYGGFDGPDRDRLLPLSRGVSNGRKIDALVEGSEVMWADQVAE